MQVKRTKRFIKSYIHLTRKLQDKVENVLEIFLKNPGDLRLTNHALLGDFKGLKSLGVTGDLRIIYRDLSNCEIEIVELIDVGTHAQLYE